MDEIKRIVNRTGHIINIIDKEGKTILSIPSSGMIRVNILPDDPVLTVLGVPFKQRRVYGTEDVELPPKIDGYIYIVSQHVANAFPQRKDLCYPDEKVKEDDRVIGCRFLRLN